MGYMYVTKMLSVTQILMIVKMSQDIKIFKNCLKLINSH
jgi:hypothetical protein